MSEEENNKEPQYPNLQNEESANREVQGEEIKDNEDNNEENNEKENENQNNNEEINENENQEEEKKEDEDEEDSKKELFYYLELKNEQKFNSQNNENLPFDELKEKCKYSICILMENNGILCSNLLIKTLTSIAKNVQNLDGEHTKITAEDIYIFVFIKEMINNDSKINPKEDDDETTENKNNYYIKEWTIDTQDLSYKEFPNFNLYTINRSKNLLNIKSLEFYYNILKQIKSNKKLIFSSIMECGITFNDNKLLELMISSYHDQKKHAISVSPIVYQKTNFISKICSYEKMRFDLYNMNFYMESNSPPINSQLCTMAINSKLMDVLVNYYKNLHSNATIEYHDYNLSLHLLSKNYLIKFSNNNPALLSTLASNLKFYDYQKMFVDRFSGYYGNFFDVLLSFKNIDILKKIFTIFQLISIFFEFVLPSIFSMIIYIIFYSAFKTTDYHLALFFTLFYLSLLLTSGICVLINKNRNKMSNTNFILNILMIFLYFLTLICSIPAMHFANKDSNPDFSGYKFDKAAISTIIIFTFIPYLIPIILNFSVIKEDFLLLFVYNLVWAPVSKINFNVSSVWSAFDSSGGKAIKERKSLGILLYLGINLFFGSLGFYNSDNKKKANCVMAFGILYLIYNFVRSVTAVVVYCFRKEELFKERNICSQIGTDINAMADEDDMRSENLPINKEKDNDDNINNDGNSSNNNEDNNNNNETNEGEVRDVEVEEE